MSGNGSITFGVDSGQMVKNEANARELLDQLQKDLVAIEKSGYIKTVGDIGCEYESLAVKALEILAKDLSDESTEAIGKIGRKHEIAAGAALNILKHRQGKKATYMIGSIREACPKADGWVNEALHYRENKRLDDLENISCVRKNIEAHIKSGGGSHLALFLT
ncbi:MAG: hypothetical protein OEY94_06445 [Alphaproteobacteria bacterium]|nr:hypothetical protein [Alphaproteobacteria bacterium]